MIYPLYCNSINGLYNQTINQITPTASTMGNNKNFFAANYMSSTAIFTSR